MAVHLAIAAVAQGIVILAVIGLEFMQYAVFAKPVQHAVNGNAVYAAVGLAYNSILAHGAAFVGKDVQDGLLCGCVPSFHNHLLQQCCNSANLHYICQTVNQKITVMQTQYDVIITGGSYAGLAAGMSLGRSLRNVLIIDSGKPCNRFTPHSQNFITHDGEVPAAIAQKAKEQVLAYPTVSFMGGLAISAVKSANGFDVATQNGETFSAKKLLFATGVKDNLPDIQGLADCWGKSVIHCPYCHGYEFHSEPTGILGNGDNAYHHALLVHNLTHNLSVFTNGPKEFIDEQLQKFDRNNIKVFESPVVSVSHKDGYISELILEDGSRHKISALYLRPQSIQHCEIPQQMGCELNEFGFIVTDMMQKTAIPGIYAAGDCCTQMRSVSAAVAQGNMAGAAINMELCSEVF